MREINKSKRKKIYVHSYSWTFLSRKRKEKVPGAGLRLLIGSVRTPFEKVTFEQGS